MFEIIQYKGTAGYPMRAGRLTTAGTNGADRAMLFIPGLGGSVKGALDFLEQLQPAYGTIYGPDLRGFGLNPLETPLNGAGMLLPDLDAFYQQVLAPAGHQELALCGISLGGVLATLLAARHPERFSKVIHMEPLILNAGFLLGVRDLCQNAFSEIQQLRLPTMMVIPGRDIVCDPAAMRAAFARIPEQTPKVCHEYPDFYHDVLFEIGHAQIAQALLQWPDHSASLANSLSSM